VIGLCSVLFMNIHHINPNSQVMFFETRYESLEIEFAGKYKRQATVSSSNFQFQSEHSLSALVDNQVSTRHSFIQPL